MHSLPIALRRSEEHAPLPPHFATHQLSLNGHSLCGAQGANILYDCDEARVSCTRCINLRPPAGGSMLKRFFAWFFQPSRADGGDDDSAIHLYGGEV